MNVRAYIYKHRILAIALSASLLWHILWLSIVKIEARPGKPGQARFSKVFFLGPILDTGAMKLKIQPRTNSFLEKRYLRYVGELPKAASRGSPESYAGYDADDETSGTGGAEMTDLINKAAGAAKSEPVYGADY